MSEHRSRLAIPASHPCLPGHFPGRPVVPAVLLLECVERALADALGRPVRTRALPAVKFTSPLAPDTEFEITLQVDAGAGTARFRCAAGERELATGRVEFA